MIGWANRRKSKGTIIIWWLALITSCMDAWAIWLVYCLYDVCIEYDGLELSVDCLVQVIF
jgi:hypothetical protein